MTITTLSFAELDVGLLSALNLSLPTNSAKLRPLLAKAAAKQQAVAELQEILDKKTFGTAADSEADDSPPLPGLVPPTVLASLDRSKVAVCQSKLLSAADDYVGADAEDTSVGARSMSRSASEGTESEVENFQMNPDAPCFVPSSEFTAPKREHPARLWERRFLARASADSGSAGLSSLA